MSISLNSKLQEAVNSVFSFLFFHSFIFSKSSIRVESNFKTSSFDLKFFVFHQILFKTAINLTPSCLSLDVSSH
ncbi:MAG: hypothetical protein LBU14_06375 [Candidatus Peribacteria bacterium]|nr:hypothetical protein [Candidatus Peribacteria bacterium]